MDEIAKIWGFEFLSFPTLTSPKTRHSIFHCFILIRFRKLHPMIHRRFFDICSQLEFVTSLLTRTFANRRSSSDAFGIGCRFLLRMLGCRMWFAINVDDGEAIMSLLQSMKISCRSFALLLFKLSFPFASIEPIFYSFFLSWACENFFFFVWFSFVLGP